MNQRTMTKIMIMIGMIGTISIAYAIQVCDYAKNSPGAKDIKPVDKAVAKTKLPNDPCQRCAAKALRGDYGKLPTWKRCAYEHIISNNITVAKDGGYAKVTGYGYLWESAAMAGGTVTASGSKVHTRGCAANPEIPFGTLVWTARGMRYVNDRGGWVKVGQARVYGKWKKVTNNKESANLDFYTEEPYHTSRNTPYAIVKQNGDRKIWFVKPPKRRRR